MARQPLSASDIERRLGETPGWALRDGKLFRELTFPSFVEAFGFMAQAALVAERQNHHPNWSNVYNRVTIELETHDAGGVTDADFKLAGAMSKLLAHA